MPADRIIVASSFTSIGSYQREVRKVMMETLLHRINLIGITRQDLEDINAVKQYKIGRDDKEYENYIKQTARALGVSLVVVLWMKEQAMISVPTVEPDYTSAKEYINNMPQKPKNV